MPESPTLEAVGVHYMALNHPLLRHGEGMAFSGLCLAGVAFLSTRGDWRKTPSEVSLGRAWADYYLRWPLLILGLAGLLVMLAAVVW